MQDDVRSRLVLFLIAPNKLKLLVPLENLLLFLDECPESIDGLELPVADNLRLPFMDDKNSLRLPERFLLLLKDLLLV